MMTPHRTPVYICSGSLAIALPLALSLALAPSGAAAHTEDDPLIVDLQAGNPKNGENIAGHVEVWNDETNLYITYKVDAPWCMTKAHTHVADHDDPVDVVPQTKKGNPIPGRFEYKDRSDACTELFGLTIPLGAWAGQDPATMLDIATHAAVTNTETDERETAWAGDVPFPGANWAMYFEYEVQETAPCGISSKCVFVTSTTHNGNLGGLAGADSICQALALDAGLRGTYKAWLADRSGSPSTRFALPQDLPYVRTDGATVADGFPPGEPLANSISLDQNADPVEPARAEGPFPIGVWTNARGDGTVWNTTDSQHCYTWRVDSPPIPSRTGIVGLHTAVDDDWYLRHRGGCNVERGLYCFQQ